MRHTLARFLRHPELVTVALIILALLLSLAVGLCHARDTRAMLPSGGVWSVWHDALAQGGPRG